MWSGILLFAFALLLGVGGVDAKAAAYTTGVTNVMVSSGTNYPTFYFIVTEPVAGQEPASISGTISALTLDGTTKPTAGEVTVSGVWKNADGSAISSGKFEEGKKYKYEAKVQNYKNIKTDFHTGEIGTGSAEVYTAQNLAGMINNEFSITYPNDGADILYTVTYTIPKTISEVNVKISGYDSKEAYEKIPEISATIEGTDEAAAFTVSDCYFYESTDATKTQVADGTNVATDKIYNIYLRLKWNGSNLYKLGDTFRPKVTDKNENDLGFTQRWVKGSGEDYLEIIPNSFIGIQTIDTINLLYDKSKLPKMGNLKGSIPISSIVSSADSKKYVISICSWAYYDPDRKDWCEAGADRFLGKVKYGLWLQITPASGYSFAEMDDIQVQINGQAEAAVEFYGDKDYYEIFLPAFETEDYPVDILCLPDPDMTFSSAADLVKVQGNNVPGLSWDAETCTLTMDGYHGSMILFGDPDSPRNDEMADLVIRVKNSNTITTQNLYPAAMILYGARTVFVGDGTLDINVKKALMTDGVSALSYTQLTIDGPTINVNNNYMAKGVIASPRHEGERKWNSAFCMKSGSLNVELVQGVDGYSGKTVYPISVFSTELGKADLIGGQINITMREITDSNVAYTKGIFADDIYAVNWENTKINITAPNGVTLPMGQGDKALSVLKDGVWYGIDLSANTAAVIGYDNDVPEDAAAIPAQITLGKPVSGTFDVVDNLDRVEIYLVHRKADVLQGTHAGRANDFRHIMEEAGYCLIACGRDSKNGIRYYDLDQNGSWDVSATEDSVNDRWIIEMLPTSSVGGNYCLNLGELKSSLNYASVMFHLPHTHNWSSDWTSDQNGHWHACRNKGCDIQDHAKMNGYGAHTFGEWSVKTPATDKADGLKVHKCSICGYEESAVIAKTAKEGGKETAKVTAPGKTNLKSVKNSAKKTLLLKWKKTEGADGYEVQYALKKNFKGAKKKTTKKLTLKIKKLKKKKTYFVRVRAYKLSGSEKVYGDWSKTKKVKVKK